METEGESRGEALKKWILSRIEEKGPIPFSQFMEWCLYHPQYGYYSTGRVRIGKEGDYYTGPCVHPLFGGMVAKQLFQMAERLGEDHFEVVEIGAGRGLLCQDVLDWADKNAPRFLKGLRYLLVETSAPLLKEQKERLHPYEAKGQVRWMDPASFEGGEGGITGCILSNELVDAFPAHCVVFENGRLREIYVTRDNGQLKEMTGPLSDPRLLSYFESMSVSLLEGQRAEVNLKALDWMEKVGRFLNRGFVLTIDYGYPAQELYAPHRRHGTLLCYARHQASDNPYQQPGEQDITSHVNFTALMKKGEEVGLRFTGLVSQSRFLIALGLLQEMEALNRKMPEPEGMRFRLSLMHLIEPEVGMGEIFKVLIQHKGVNQPLLDGLRDLHSIHWPSFSSRNDFPACQKSEEENRRGGS